MMKKTFLFSLFLSLSVWVSGNEPNKSFMSTTPDWNKMADGMVQALIDNFWGAKFEGHPNRYYFNYKSHQADLTTGHYWPQAHAMDVIVDAYMRTQKQEYRDIYPLWWLGAPTYNFARKSKGAWWNPYVDDMEWMALAQIRMFESTGNRIYISKAREIYDDWVWTTWGPEDEAPWYGGITWKTDVNKSKNACSNGPAAIIAARIYRFYDKAGFVHGKGKDAYLEEALKIYGWLKKHLFNATTGAVSDNMNMKGRIDPAVYTYNQGTFIGAAYELFLITGEKQYMDDAVKAAGYVMNKMTRANQGVLSDAPGGDGGLFHGIFFRYFVKMANEKSLPADTRKEFHQFLTHQATVMATEGINPNTMLYGGKWREAPADDAPVSLTAHLSGCMLMEAMCVLEPME